MKSYCVLICGLFFSAISYAGEGEIIFNLILTPITSLGIPVDSTKLILYDNDNSIIKQVVISEDTIVHQFDHLDAGKYFLLVQLYQQNYILTENLSSGYINAHESKKINGNVSLACAWPILHVNWNPDISLGGDDFYDFAIDPDSNFLKRYPLDNLDSLSATFRNSGMHYYNKCLINTKLLDTNLIPRVHYSSGDHRNPVTTCHTVFAFYDEYMKSKDTMSFKGFVNNLNWLLDNCDSNYYLHYEFSFKHDREQLPAGWISGMAQGLALSALSLGYYFTDEQKYLDGAHGIFTTIYRNSGGYYCIGVDEKGYYWLEEYPSSRFCHVFNGMVSGLWGIWCYYTITGDDFARALLESGIKSIVDNYPQWNCPDKDLSYYCLHNTTMGGYHKKHLMQLRYFGDYFDVPELHHAADCFSNNFFAAYPASIKLISDKSRTGIILFSTLNWDVKSDADWLTFQRTENNLDVLCNENLFYEGRTANISFTVSDTTELQMIQVTQDAAPVYPIADINSINVSSDSGLVWLEVKSRMFWNVSCENPWIEATRVNKTMLAVKYLNNTSGEKRTAELKVCMMGRLFCRKVEIVQE